MEQSHFLWFPWLFHRITEGNVHIAHGVVVFLFLLMIAVFYRFSLKPLDQEIIPDEKVSVKNILQSTIQALLKLMRGVIPHHTEDYFPLIGSIFIYIFLFYFYPQIVTKILKLNLICFSFIRRWVHIF